MDWLKIFIWFTNMNEILLYHHYNLRYNALLICIQIKHWMWKWFVEWYLKCLLLNDVQLYNQPCLSWTQAPGNRGAGGAHANYWLLMKPENVYKLWRKVPVENPLLEVRTIFLCVFCCCMFACQHPLSKNCSQGPGRIIAQVEGLCKLPFLCFLLFFTRIN